MAETLRELVVALSLDSSNFSRNMRTINQQIKEAESTFRLAGAGVENYEKTIAGTEAKLSIRDSYCRETRVICKRPCADNSFSVGNNGTSIIGN